MVDVDFLNSKPKSAVWRQLREFILQILQLQSTEEVKKKEEEQLNSPMGSYQNERIKKDLTETLLKIETLFSEINKALAWNRREEDALANEMRTRIEGSNELIHKEFKRKRKYYTEKLQIQLAKCTQIGSAIETNIQVASFLRNIGLYTFFIVLQVRLPLLESLDLVGNIQSELRMHRVSMAQLQWSNSREN